MKLRTIEELDDALEREISWRKKELRDLQMELRSAKWTRRRTVARACVTISYAHLEGFFKAAATIYLKYLSSASATVGELNLCFQAICATRYIRTKYSGSMPSDPIDMAHEVLCFLTSSANDTAKMAHKDVVMTHSNLNSARLQALLRRTGLDDSLFALKHSQIDKGLLHARNNVAHGQFIEVDDSEVLEWIEMVLEMCQRFRDELSNGAATDAWRHAKSSEADDAYPGATTP